LDHFVTARIVVSTESGKYNLVHDYFAPLILFATEGLETQAERSNRLLKRYIAQYKDDSRVRIPTRDLWLICKASNPELRSSSNGKKLLQKDRLD